MSGMILHIPHASQNILVDFKDVFILDPDVLKTELLRMTDAYTDELYDHPSAARIIFPISRLIVDPERFVVDDEEPMSAMGMGVIYTKTSHGDVLKREMTSGERRELLDRFYYPHHKALREAVQSELFSEGSVLIVDCHSFPSRPLPCDMDQMYPRPDFCIGTDPFHTSAELLNKALAAIREQGYSVMVDRPYSGTIVPIEEYRKNKAVSSIMIEVRRDLYMDEATGAKNKNFDKTRNVIAELLKALLSS